MQVDRVDGPSHWASYFINGDDSGLSDKERREADAWQESLAPAYIVSCEGESFFGRFAFPESGYLGADLVEYVTHAPAARGVTPNRPELQWDNRGEPRPNRAARRKAAR